MRKTKDIFLLLLIFLLFTEVAVADLKIGGKMEQEIVYDHDQEEFSQIVTDYSIELTKDLGLAGNIYLSLAGEYDSLNNYGIIDLDQAYTAIFLSQTDLFIGKQLINWGRADGINPTNSINPIDNSFSLQEADRVPLLAAQSIYYGSNYDLSLVLVPNFVPQNKPELEQLGITDEEMREAMELAFTDTYENIEQEVPDTLENAEFALKYTQRFQGYDLELSYFHGWEDLPALQMVPQFDENGQPLFDPVTSEPVLLPAAEFRRQDKLGLAMAGSINEIGVWLETAYLIPEELNNTSPGYLLVKNEPYFQSVLGADYTFDNDLYLELQYINYGNGSLLQPYESEQDIEPGQYLMNRFSYPIDDFNELELTAVINLKDQSGIIKPGYIYHFNDVTDLKINPLLSFGDGEFDTLNNQLIVKLETYF